MVVAVLGGVSLRGFTFVGEFIMLGVKCAFESKGEKKPGWTESLKGKI